MSDDDDHGFSLVMPFVICATQGGPFDDDAFAAGCQCGVIDTEASTIGTGRKKTWTVPTTIVPQLDLIAMRYGCLMVKQENEEFPEWVDIEFRR